MTDWSQGEYERTAAALAPVAEVAVAALAPQPGQRVLDVACGTGNAAALVEDAGSDVTGIDAADRLIEVARDRLPGATFVVGDAAALPFADDAFDAAVSVFGIIFATAPAAGELIRVLRPGGRAVITAWLPEGPIFEVARLARSAGPPAADAPPLIAWHERDTLQRLFECPVRIERHSATFTAPSAEGWWDEQAEHHPVWLAAGATLSGVRDDAVAILRAASSRQDCLRIASPYIVARVEA